MATPHISTQRDFWDGWNRQHRTGTLDPFMERQKRCAVEWAERLALRNARILDLGCGTGWLGAALSDFGNVTGTDLSPAAIERGRASYANVTLLCGDFAALDLDGPFDLVVTADVIAHLSDQGAFVARIAEHLRAGGTLLLMTQNPTVWNRRSTLVPRAEGQLRNWPSLARIRELLRDRFEVVHVGSIVPGGDRGLLWWVENRWVRGGAELVFGRARWNRLLERGLLGRELVVVARRKGGAF